MVTPHLAVDGVLRPVLPEEGPCRDEPSKEGCRLRVQGRRVRKTGPCFPLTVLRCRTHGRAFTVYPPGHVPYGRQALAPVAADGSQEHLVPDEGTRPLERWQGTLFRAALDAERGVAWPRSPALPEPACWRSQGRQLTRILDLLGLSPGQEEFRHSFAEALRVDTLLLREQAGRLVRPPVGYRQRGQAAVAALAAVEAGGCALDAVQRAGHLAGAWGLPWTWEPARRVLRAPAFPASGRRPP